MSVYNLIEYSHNYWKISGGLWQYYRNEPSLTPANAIGDFSGAKDNDKLSKFKENITGKVGSNSNKMLK